MMYNHVLINELLLVEDDQIIANGLIYALEQEGYSVTHCGSVAEALRTLGDMVFDLAILDMQLPDGMGTEIQSALTDTAVIFLTVVDDEGNIVRAFECGAADYVTKPFRLRELLARVKRAISSTGGIAEKLMLGSVTIDVSSGKAYIDNNLLELTALEYRLLLTFAMNKGQILSRSRILENIWDASGNFVEDNTLTVYIKRLREKLGDAANIETVRGLGYRVD
jgi:DNA-binding response OmpR family regulator